MSETQSKKVHLPTADSTSKKHFWPRELVLGLLPLLIGFELLLWIVYLPSGLHGLAVFRTLYVSGYMVRTHDALHLHDYDKMNDLSDRLVPVGQTLNQPMDHPAYEALLLAPLSLLSYRKALIVFIFINFVLLALCAQLLRPSFRVLSERWKFFPPLLFAGFFPVTYALTRGADSIILFALFSGAIVLIENRREYAAGILLGLGFFKFQIVIPVALMFFLWKRRRFVLGFAISATSAALLSFLMVGSKGAKQYASMLLGMSVNLRSEEDAVRYSLSPLTMLNLRGLISALFQTRLPHWWVQGLIFLTSVVVLVIAARCRPSLSLAIITAALVSYHLNAPDATVFLIPIGICLCSDSVWITLMAIAALIFPVAAIVPIYAFVGGVPILGLFVACVVQKGVLSESLYKGVVECPN